MYLDNKEFILSEIDCNYASAGEEQTFNICYGLDKNFLFGCGISIASILLTNPQAKFTFHVFTDYFSDDFREQFDLLAKENNTRIIIYLINCESLKKLPSTKNWSYATYFRFIIADYFTGKLEKILYLDADIACKGSVQELIDLEYNSNEIAAVVIEGNDKWWKRRAEHLSTPGLSNGYFNAGFLLINIPAWAADNISARAIELLSDPEVANIITHLDQDVLNILLVGKVRFIDKKFNTQYSLNYELKAVSTNPVQDSTVFVHYIGPTKPWHSWSGYPVSTFFYQGKEASPWRTVPLLEPGNALQCRYAAKHFLKQKKTMEALRCWAKYYLYKIKTILN